MKIGILIEKGKQISQAVSLIENPALAKQVNVVLRTESNEAFGIIKLVDGESNFSATLSENIIANYIYIDKDTEINNMKFKVTVSELKTDNSLVQNEVKTDY